MSINIRSRKEIERFSDGSMFLTKFENVDDNFYKVMTKSGDKEVFLVELNMLFDEILKKCPKGNSLLKIEWKYIERGAHE